IKSATFSQVLAGPSGYYYDYFDAGLDGFHSLVHFGLLSWFASRSDQGFDWNAYKDLLAWELEAPRAIERTRFFSMHFLNIAAAGQEHNAEFVHPWVWTGRGDEPICVFRDTDNDKRAFFLAAKGGRAADNHGNMDAGSFIFELDGVRWAVDPGNQGYNKLEQIIGGELWNNAQESGRWALLTKNNFGHSTLTVNGEKYIADARANLVKVDRRSNTPEVSFDMTKVFGNSIEKATRSFARISGDRLRIRDDLVFSARTRTLTWQLITRADVQIDDGVIVLREEEKKLEVHVPGDTPYRANVVSLSPPPLTYDKDIPGLKRIEIHFSREAFPGDRGQIMVYLTNGKK
ncbi:MAG: heparinase II/III family protein, partial [Bacteroidales bacterium]|nr:heparinase II/III family protein [Bacteroidales bacterium]